MNLNREKEITYQQAGAGKSVLWSVVTAMDNCIADIYPSATAVEALPALISSTNGIMVYFFGSFEEKEKATLHFLMSIAAQFVSRSQRCFNTASERQKSKKGFSLTISDYVNLVESFMGNYDQVVIVVDALDEVEGMQQQEKEAFVAVLRQFMGMQGGSTITDHREPTLGRQKGIGRKIMITSREDAYIRTSLAHECKCISWNLDSQHLLRADLEQFVSAELQERMKSNRICLRDPKLVPIIKDQVLQTAGT